MPTIEPVSLAIGAEVRDVDLSRDLSERAWKAIEAAFHQHSVLVFRDQEISIEDQKRFARRFGEIMIHAHLLPLTVEGHPECMALHNDAQRPPGLNAWHTDNSGWEKPPLGTLLYAKKTPPLGGDTLFSSMYLAYEALSRPMQQMLLKLGAVHDVKKAFGPGYANLQQGLKKKGIDPDEHFARFEPVVHPLVRTHPATRRRALYLSGPYVTHIDGLSRAESAAILDFLYRHLETNEFIYRHRWRRHDLVIWDNRCTQHLAVADYYPQERLMYRMNVAGERPFLDP
jgi:taurine dioxygenase